VRYGRQALIIFGAVVDEEALAPGEVSITLIATGFGAIPGEPLPSFMTGAPVPPPVRPAPRAAAPPAAPPAVGAGGAPPVAIPAFLKNRRK
jgi:hypothetical protein